MMLHESLAAHSCMSGQIRHMYGADRSFWGKFESDRGDDHQNPRETTIYYISPDSPIMTVLTSLFSRPSALLCQGQGMGARALHGDREDSGRSGVDHLFERGRHGALWLTSDSGRCNGFHSYYGGSVNI